MLSAREFLDQLLDDSALSDLAVELDAFCRAHDVVGLHYTRALADRIERCGLVLPSGEDRRESFLAEFGHLFSEAQRSRLHRGWEAYFDEEQNELRNGRIWFNLTTAALRLGGADPLLRNYGGEVIYMPFSRDGEISEILASIGESLIVECALQTDSVTTFSEHPWGETWLSTYHCSVNPNALRSDVDLYTMAAVAPDRILGVHTYKI